MCRPLELDRSVRVVGDGRVLVGADPPRVIRLSAAGVRELGTLCDGSAADIPALRKLGRWLVERAGACAYPPAVSRNDPRAGAGDVGSAPRARAARNTDLTVVVPVDDRRAALDRRLAAICIGAGQGLAVVLHR